MIYLKTLILVPEVYIFTTGLERNDEIRLIPVMLIYNHNPSLRILEGKP